MKRFRLFIIVLGLAGIAYGGYAWFKLPPDRTVRLQVLMAYELRQNPPASSFAWQLWALVSGRATALWQHRLLAVVALGFGIVEGLHARKHMAFAGFHRNLWLSSGMAICLMLGLVGIMVMLPFPMPYQGMVVIICLLSVWVGWSGTVGFPVSR